MRHRLDVWWHQRIVGHSLGPTVPAGVIRIPWPDLPFPDVALWVTRCSEPGCFRVWVDVDSFETVDAYRG